jgi:alkylated DNA repair dioxygenase AlkB
MNIFLTKFCKKFSEEFEVDEEKVKKVVFPFFSLERDENFLFIPNFLPSTNFYTKLLKEIPSLGKEYHTLKIMGKQCKEGHSGSSHSLDTSIRYKYSGNDRETKEFTPSLLELKEIIEKELKKQGILEEPFNFVHANFYKNGSESIGWHPDDEKGIKSRVVASLSFGQKRKFRIKGRKQGAGWLKEYLLGDGDLFVMFGNFQKMYKHCVPKESKIKKGRINLTFRVIGE